MIRTTVRISGMVCRMCEAHVNDAVRSAFAVKKVSPFRARGETVIESLTGSAGGFFFAEANNEGFRRSGTPWPWL